MTESTIMAVYETAAQAEGALEGLRRAQVPESAISQQKGGKNLDGTPGSDAAESGEAARPAYNRTLRRGSIVVTVTNVDAAKHDSVASILESHDPVDINEHVS